MACGLAESGKAVAISCRCYCVKELFAGFNGAYHRSFGFAIPQSDKSRYGHLEDQVIDRTQMPIDAVKAGSIFTTSKMRQMNGSAPYLRCHS